MGQAGAGSGGDLISNGGYAGTHGGSNPAYAGSGPTYAGSPPASGGGRPSYGGSEPAYAGSPPSIGGSANVGGERGFPDCESPTTDPITHNVQCANGFWHRPLAVACSVVAEGGTGATGEAGAAGASGLGQVGSSCELDSDCTALALGFCDRTHFPRAATCQAGCRQDSDCLSNQFCLCDGSTHGGSCQAATCRKDAECGTGSLCAATNQICTAPVGGIELGCFTTTDKCSVDSDCLGNCVFWDDSRVCNNLVCGRPFLVADEPRLASLANDAGWLTRATRTPDLNQLSPRVRAALAAHWARLGQMEHASIAAFARFNLQLLSLGVPAALLETCNQAIADETAHARLCFDMASHYGGTPVGPGRLDISRCLEVTSLTEIMKLVLVEGCLGETTAALEAQEAADLTTDPAVKEAFLRIANDEQRHAELAFVFLKWALAESSPEGRAQLALATDQHLAELERAPLQLEPASEDDTDLSMHGVLPESILGTIRHRASRDVVRPLLHALLAQGDRPPTAAQSTDALELCQEERASALS